MTYPILFPSELFAPKEVDGAFADQHRAAHQAGLTTHFVDQDKLDAGEFAGAVRKIDGGGAIIYRGWMLSTPTYRGLFDALAARGFTLINSPAQYQHCHHLPESFEHIATRSPASVWVPLEAGVVNIDRVVQEARVFGDAPVVIKDYVKSRKHEWEEACFVPSATDEAQLTKVVRTFVERQDASLVGGVVVRKFVELESVGNHPKSGMPLTREHRVFVLDGEPLITGRYWAEATYANEGVPLGEFADVMAVVRSRFFTMDLALGVDGQWCIIELGDGQVAGLLDTIAPSDFYGRLAERTGV